MKKMFLFLLSAGLMTFGGLKADLPKVKNELRAPAYPLITIDPYTSGWSMTDTLYNDQVKHWTGKEFPLIGAVRVDGKTYRFMGVEKIPIVALAGMSTDKPWTGKFTFSEPEKGWETPEFKATGWQSAEAAFGTKDETNVKTTWNTKDIWVRREIKLDSKSLKKKLFLKYSHDDILEVYVNGKQVVKTGYVWRKDVILELPSEVIKTITNGSITIAAHCHNQTGGALIDFGVYTEADMKKQLPTTANQKSVDVQATQTRYVFNCGNIELRLTFMAPLLMNNLDVMSRPVNYISYDVNSLDGKQHQVDLYFEAAPNWALNIPSQASKSEGSEKDGLLFVKTGSVSQNILAKKGDDVRIDWGYFFLSSEKANATSATGNPFEMRQAFVKNGKLSGDVHSKENANLAISQSLGKTKSVSGKIMVGYDDLYSIQYFGQNLRPFWNKEGSKTIETAFSEANKEFADLKQKCDKFDNDLMSEAISAGGKKYAELCALAYRQAIAAHKLVQAPNGDLLFFSKENFSNGSIGTVDVTYPSAPLFLYYNPELAKGLLNHIFYYSESGKWQKSFPAHDVGTYPLANGQTYGADMPVEESGNMLTLTAAIAAMEGNAKYAEKHWTVLTTWADYLVKNGLNPENQLCTDDFAGHFAHNVNLSAKAIMGVASYGYLAKMLGKNDISENYLQQARQMATEWIKMADNGDHYRLTFDKPDTWSQKYNLVWDKLLNLNIFPADVTKKEISFCLTKQNKYGLPLDNRKNYTKSDWIIWTSTLATDKETFQKFIDPMYRFMNETTDRIPMTDWYNTDNTRHVGFQARSVVGGYFIKMLDEKINNK